jgi:phosphoribosyl-ATP pyrophosphohydrolase
MTEREKEVIKIIKKYPEEILEVVLDLLKKDIKSLQKET